MANASSDSNSELDPLSDPNSEIYKVLLEMTYEMIRNPDKEIAGCTESIRLNPERDMSYFCRAQAYECKNDLDKAIADYTEAIRLRPGMAAYYCSRGKLYSQKGDTDSAVSDYTEALRLDPDSEDAQNYLASLNKA